MRWSVEGYTPYQWAFNLKLRVNGQEAYVRFQSEESVSRATNAKTRKVLNLLRNLRLL